MTASNRFKVVEPITIDDVKFYSGLTDLSEPDLTGPNPDPALWNSATAYNVGDRVSRLTTHSVYQRRVAGTTATQPESDAANWVRVGPTNRWAMFDQSNSTQTQKTDNFTFYLFLGTGDICDHLVFDNVDADSIRLTIYDAALTTTYYDATKVLKYRSISDWWDYFFQRWVYRRTAVFDGLPLFAGVVFAVTVFRAGQVAKVGTCVAGRGREIGDAKPDPDVGIRDYSTKEADTFGNTSIVKRAYSKRMNVSVLVRSADVDSIVDFLATLRATPALYLGAGSLYNCMVMLGYYKDFGMVIPGPALSECNLQIEGLT